ncbi:MAG: DUF2271 domain-containing protein [Bacteroidales bacterium]|jgi:flagellar hook assembly protein FlgD|nr:DUF2271 domain-containing protein [Bacteroidales bacterium]
MKHLIISILLLGSFLLQAQVTPGMVNISVTSKANGNAFSPKHVLAIWVEDNSATFVKTLKLQADKRKQYLYTWNNISAGNTTDATTGATLNSHQAHTLTWDCTNVAGEVIEDGTYTINIEYTSEHKQGPLTSIEFTKSDQEFSFQPADETYFTDMDLMFTPNSTSGIENQIISNRMSVYPVPARDQCFIDFDISDSKNIQLKVYSAEMKEVAELWNGDLNAGNHSFTWNIKGTESISGTYFVVLSGDKIFSARQVVVTE